MLTIAAEMDWEVVQLDVKSAFLYAEIEEVFVEAAPGFERTDEDGSTSHEAGEKPVWTGSEPRELVKDDRPSPHHSCICSAQVRHLHLHLQEERHRHHPYSLRG